jgi:hypothetical protein
VSPSLVTLGLVEEGVIMGTWCLSAMGAMASERLEATSPSSTCTLSSTTRRVVTRAASSCLPWLS